MQGQKTPHVSKKYFAVIFQGNDRKVVPVKRNAVTSALLIPDASNGVETAIVALNGSELLVHLVHSSDVGLLIKKKITPYIRTKD